MVAPRRTALLEESAEVEVLFANMEKMKTLTKKIQASVNRLDASGKAVQEAISPIYGNTQKLQIANANVDRIIEAIERLRAPREESAKEERIIRAGPGRGDLDGYIASLDRTNLSLQDLKRTNLRSNEQAVAELSGLLKLGNKQLEDVFRSILQDCSRGKVQPLEYVAKRMCWSCTMYTDALTVYRKPVSSHAPREAPEPTQHQHPHHQNLCPSIASRPVANSHTKDICRDPRRISRKHAAESDASVDKHCSQGAG